jgi:PHP family Zn ribbon phosphoesterase
LRHWRVAHPTRQAIADKQLQPTTLINNAHKEPKMVKHFDPSCPKCDKKFHVHHEDLRYAGIKLLCPYCQNEFFVDECTNLIEHDGTLTHPNQKAQAH